MSNLTANDTRGLMEAYTAVYDKDLREKLEEEKVREFSKQFMNLLIEEGYDVSNITENDLYEYFISENLGLLSRLAAPVLAGAKPVAKGILRQIGKYSIPTAALAGADQYFSGGRGRDAIGGAIQGLRQLGHSIPSSGEIRDQFVKPKPKEQKPPKSPTPVQTPGQEALPGFESFDPLEVIKSHLLDEGYASTENQAIRIMAHMSEGWKNSILNNIVVN